MTVIGSPIPDFTFGFRNVFNYKRLELDIFIQGQYGNEILNGNWIEFLYPSNFRRNRSGIQMRDRWTPDNPNAKWPSATAYGGGQMNSLAVEDASYLRLKTVQLSYDLPVNSNSRFVRSARVYVNAQNLFTLTRYSGFDPEANVFGDNNVHIDYNAYPMARILMLGVNLNF
jgi:hypothetical protein